MAGSLSTFLVNALLAHALKNSAYTPAATVYLGLSTTIPTDAGGFTEVSGGAYARQALSLANPSNRQTVNNAVITFPIATASWGNVVGWGIFDASSAGNLLVHGELLGDASIFTVNTGTDVITTDLPHGYSNDQTVEVEVDLGDLPSPLVDNTAYFVRDVTASTFKLALTLGGAAIDLTTTGNGLLMVARTFKVSIAINDTISIANSQLLVRIRATLDL